MWKLRNESDLEEYRNSEAAISSKIDQWSILIVEISDLGVIEKIIIIQFAIRSTKKLN